MDSETEDRRPEDEKVEPPATVTFRHVTPQLRSGRYSLRRFHARGGMGEVWLAEDCEINRLVALKRLRKNDQWSQDHFIAEAQITGQLEHPSVAPVHDFGHDDEGHPFYIMKFIHGRTLKEAVAAHHGADHVSDSQRHVEWLQLLNVFVDVCQAVAFAHSRGVLHRDLKPDNIMLGPYGETVVLDWGLAKVKGQTREGVPDESSCVRVTRTGGSSETEAGSVVGAPAYMAPEVAEGRADEIDETTDVYLLGACLYHILTGDPPRRGSSRSEMIELARTVDPVAPRQKNPRVDRPLQAICLKAMNHRKEDRYQTAEALAEDMRRYLAGEPVSAYPEGIVKRTLRWARRHRAALSRAAVAMLIVATVLFGVVQLRRAKLLEARETARRQITDFHRLADEMRYFAASTNPPDQRAPYYDPALAEAVAAEALTISQRWGDDLSKLPLAEQRDQIKKELYELLLLRVQTRLALSHDSEHARQLMDELKRARWLARPSRSYYRLQSELFRLMDERAEASRADRLANDAKTRSTALDEFLLGESFRMRAIVQPDPSEPKPDRVALEKAVQAYKRALDKDPDHYWAHFQLGRCYLALGRGPEAVEALSACIALRPDVPWARSARGLALALLGRFSEAERDLNAAVDAHPQFAPARLNRGVAYWLEKKHESALKDFDAILQSPPEQRLIEAAYYRGQVHLERGQIEQARDDFEAVVAARPGFEPVYLLLARTHFLLGQDDAAMRDLTTLLRVGSEMEEAESPEACARRGGWLRRIAAKLPSSCRKRVLALALEQLRRAVDGGAPSASAYVDLGAVLKQTGKLSDAIDAYTKGLALEPEHARLRIHRGWTWVSLKRYEEAEADFAKASSLEPENAEARTGWGYAQACLKKDAAARRQATQALLLGAGDYLILHNAACVYAELSQNASAEAPAYEQIAMDLISRAAELWRRGGAGPNEIQLIKVEPAFAPLRDRPDFQKLIANGDDG